MSQVSNHENTDQTDASESDSDILYRLPTSSEHSDGSDHLRGRVTKRDEIRSCETKKRERQHQNGNTERAVTKGPNFLHNHEGARENSSDHSLRDERLSRTPRSERPGELEVVAEVHDSMTSTLPPFNNRSGGRQQHK